MISVQTGPDRSQPASLQGRSVDLNADLGESFGAYQMGNDAALLPLVTSANIACGFHGGDPLVMHETMRLTLANGGNIGAHPSFRDLWGFGRRAMPDESPEDVHKAVVYQIGASLGMARALGASLRHVKLHGALANIAFARPDLADAVVRAVADVDPDLVLIVMPGSALEKSGAGAGLRLCREIYADRAYDSSGNLAPRRLPGAILHDPAEICLRIRSILATGIVRCADTRDLSVGHVDSICVHGDTPEAIGIVLALREALAAEGVVFAPFRPAEKA